MSRVYPRMWHELNEAISAFKERRVPLSWKAKDMGRYVLERDYLHVRREVEEARRRIAELEANSKKQQAAGKPSQR